MSRYEESYGTETMGASIHSETIIIDRRWIGH